jgi:hypothetical protein
LEQYGITSRTKPAFSLAEDVNHVKLPKLSQLGYGSHVSPTAAPAQHAEWFCMFMNVAASFEAHFWHFA